MFTRNASSVGHTDEQQNLAVPPSIYKHRHEKLTNLLSEILRQPLSESLLIKKHIYVLADVINRNPIIQDQLDLGLINYDQDMGNETDRNQALINVVTRNISPNHKAYDNVDEKAFQYMISNQSTVTLQDTCLLVHYARIFDETQASARDHFYRGAIFARTDHYSWIYTHFDEENDTFYDIVGNIYYLIGRPISSIPSALQRIFLRLITYLDTEYITHHMHNLNMTYNRISFTYYIYFLLMASAVFDELSARKTPYVEICQALSEECKATAISLVSWKLKHVDVR